MKNQINEIRSLLRDKEDLSYSVIDKVCDVLDDLESRIKDLENNITD